ncbi:MAG: hypothetical protein ACWGMZ_08215, partial [Thermoguttaceae bacterium]
MSESFDPYHRWLGIPPKDQPAHHYRLLGIELFEDDPEVIRDAAQRQMAHVRNYQLGRHSALSQKILNELATAKTCLLDSDKKIAYDAEIKDKFNTRDNSFQPFNTLPPPLPAERLTLPSIAENFLSFDRKKAGKNVSAVAGKMRGVRSGDKTWGFLIGLGVAVASAGIFLAIFGLPINRLLSHGKNNSSPLDTPSAMASAPKLQTAEDRVPRQTLIHDAQPREDKLTAIEQTKNKPNPPELKKDMAAPSEAEDKNRPIFKEQTPNPPQHKPIEVAEQEKSYEIKKTPVQNVQPSEQKPPQLSVNSNSNRIQTLPIIKPKKLRTSNRFESVIKNMVSAFNDKDFVGMRRDFAFNMNRALPLKNFARAFRGLRDNYGEITSFGPPRIRKLNAVGRPNTSMVSGEHGSIKFVVTTPGYKNASIANFDVHFERGTGEFHVLFDLQTKIIGLWLSHLKKDGCCQESNATQSFGKDFSG